MSSSSRTPRTGDIVLLSQGIGVIRYYGNVDWDVENKYFGVELKGPSISGGHNGTYDGKQYFTTTGGDGRGIFVKYPNILRVISSEEILEKLAEIYDILKGRKGHSHFIDRATYEDLLKEHQELQDLYHDKETEVRDISTDLAIEKEKISMMKGTLGDKIDETAQMSKKIQRAEKKLGSRLSQFDMESVKKKLETENNDIEQPIEVPDYSMSANENKKKGHSKQRSSTTIDLDGLDDDFSDIARTVQAYGKKNIDITGPTHYRRFSNTTKQILDEHKKAGQQVGKYNNGTSTKKASGHKARESMQIGVVDYSSDEQQKLERQSENEEEESDSENNDNKRKKKTRLSRESRQIEDDELNNGTYFNEAEENERQERESNEENESDTDNNQQKKRTVKSRLSRESRQLDGVEVTYGDDDNAPPKRTTKSRQSRQSRQLEDGDVDNYGSEDEDEEDDDEDENDRIMSITDDAMGNNMQIDSTSKQVKRNKARGSFQIPSVGGFSAAQLETHNEHHLEEEAGQINGPKGDKKHKKSDTMTSDSSAYRAFMSVD